MVGDGLAAARCPTVSKVSASQPVPVSLHGWRGVSRCQPCGQPHTHRGAGHLPEYGAGIARQMTLRVQAVDAAVWLLVRTADVRHNLQLT
jgi:hypothetical protein